MVDIVPYTGGALDESSEQLLFERVATHYIELSDISSRRVKIEDALASVEDSHPGWVDHDTALVRLKSKTFADYLVARRKTHLIEKVVPTLYAAEAGAKLGGKAAEILMNRLERIGDGGELQVMADRDLINLMKIAFELAQKADRTVSDATGSKDIQVNVDLRGLLMGLPPDLAQAYMEEVGRRLIVGGSDEG